MNGIWTIATLILLPFLGGMIPSITRRSVLVVLPLILATILSIFNLIRLSEYVYRFEWLPGFEMGWRLDGIAIGLVCLVLFISSLVHLFSVRYINEKEHVRYFLKLGFFTSSMVGLLLADHLILMFIFWELVGFSSYLLIGFWYTKVSSSKSAKRAFIVNRIADVALLGSVIVIGQKDTYFISEMSITFGGLVGLGLVIGAMGKSAQFPFSAWLPRAMTGPTPVSALIHAATMVTAGVYLLIRMNDYMSGPVLLFIAVVGVFTALYGAFVAINQNDLKQILAYSTVSQLGFMFLALGVGSGSSAFFHLWTHGFFKAGLFLAAGVLILQAGQQDIRSMNWLGANNGIMKALLIVFSLSLVGIPLFSGFQSKEGILTAVWDWTIANQEAYVDASLLFYAGIFGVVLTALYTGRMLIFLLFQKPIDGSSNKRGASQYLIPLSILGLFSFWLAHAWNPISSESWILSLVGFEATSHAESIVLLTSVCAALIGLLFGWYYYSDGRKYDRSSLSWEKPTSLVGQISKAGLGLDRSFNMIGMGYLKLSTAIYWIDLKIIDMMVNVLGVAGVVLSRVFAFIDYWIIDGVVRLFAWIARRIGSAVSGIQSAQIQSQIIWLIFGLILILSLILLF